MGLIKIVLTLVVLYSLLYSTNELVFSSLSTGDAIVPNDKDYFKYKDTNVEVIFTKDNLPFAKQTVLKENQLNKDYAKYFNWKLDDTLFVGLVSSHNQVANGFSTQWPKNRQINYMGGTELIDYLSSTSWLDTLIYHETAHNYQLNVKGNELSQDFHSIFGNGSIFSYMIPITVPNIMENSFMLEGNAVLNESWHGNGGRLYSGRFKAETIIQAKAGNIVAAEVYNSKISFPYGDIHYILGGFYNLYMAEMYGLEKTNSYFREHSKDILFPQFTNSSMKEVTGVSFEDSLNEFAKIYAQKKLVMAKGTPIASSQFFYSLNNNKDEIFFTTNKSGVQEPELVVIDKKTFDVKKTKDSWLAGKVLKIDGEYYTQGSKHISPYFISQGLFSKDAFIKKGTESKMVQGYLSGSIPVYFDVPLSYSQAQLYIGDRFHSQVNSSVFIDAHDNIYYFVQKGKIRILYKNKRPLYAYKGFYGIVSDVDSKGAVYFIANSKNGSTLYRYANKRVTRASRADNIIEARLINDREVLIAAISDKDYYYVKNKLTMINQRPYETKLFFEDKSYYAKNYNQDLKSSKLDFSNPYNALLDMHYSGTNLYVASGANGGLIGSLNLDFGDSLSQNTANIFLSKDDSEVTIAGIGYANSQYILNYNFNLYSVVNKDARDDVRDTGVALGASFPFLQTGYYYGELSASYFQDYDTKQREPLSLSVSLSRAEKYGKSYYINYLNQLQIYGVSQRKDEIFGANYMFRQDIGDEFYLGIGAKFSYLYKNVPSGTLQEDTRGVKVTNISGIGVDMDPSTITMPSVTSSIYLKGAAYADISLAKVINYSKYYFAFPFSLQRETIYAKYRYYKINLYYNKEFEVNEATLGLGISGVFFNSHQFPLTLEYIYNDGDSSFIDDKYKYRFVFGTSF